MWKSRDSRRNFSQLEQTIDALHSRTTVRVLRDRPSCTLHKHGDNQKTPFNSSQLPILNEIFVTGRFLSELDALESKTTKLLSCFTLRNSLTHLSEVLFLLLLSLAFADSLSPFMFYQSATLFPC